MPSKKKKFIDKKNAVSFHLVHRSQRDPLQASEEAAKGVLLPVDKEKQQEEQQKYGIFFEDGYDYLQHLKDANEVYELEPVESFRIEASSKKEPKLTLPSSVFASEVETEVGLLNKAVRVSGPQPDWDPDIVEALDEDFDFDDPNNQLDDDFILKANAAKENEDESSEEEDDDVASDEADISDAEMGSDFGDGFGDQMFGDEETKSHFTNYSMTSSVIRRNDGLTLLDDRFEKLYEQYEDAEIGSLDHEEIDGSVQQGSHLLNNILDDFERQQAEVKLKDFVDAHEGEDVKVESDSGDSVEMVNMAVEEPSQKWDCESILSTYSNLYNHPKLIEEPNKFQKIKLTTKLAIPAESLPQPGLTRKQIEQEMRESRRADKASTYRPQGETPEEKKTRKQSVKEERKERRAEKKGNKLAFSKEKVRQQKEVVNLKTNLQGVKLL